MMISIVLLLFPLAYLISFLYSLRGVVTGNYQALLVFFIFGLPIYITSLSILHLNGWDIFIPFFQYSKEILIIVALGLLLYQLPKMPVWNWLDRFMLVYFVFTALFLILPVGSFGLIQKIIAFKNISFFPLLYFIGRLLHQEVIWVSKLQKQVMLLAVMAMIILVGEVILSTHLQTITGYASFYEKYFSFDPAGNYGLSWTFEMEGGVKRFASFFANPLEHAASTLITVAILAIVLHENTSMKEPKLFFSALLASLLSILFALSRASLVGYIIASYLIFRLLKKKKILFFYHSALLLLVLLVVSFALNSTFTQFIVDIFSFTDSSSVSHLLEWIDGIEAIAANPLGMGLGESGRIAGALGLNTGGENQFIILGVQCGLVAVLLYVIILGITIYQSAFLVRNSTGKAAQLGIMVFIIKVGLLIPLLTASVESYLYVSYLGWFLTGFMSSAWSSIHNLQPATLK